jgi:lipoate-protein ligase B
MKRQVPAEMVEQWMTHLRLQRTRARDMIWLIEQGATFHDGREGEPTHDATARWLAEQRTVVADVDRLVGLYDSING